MAAVSSSSETGGSGAVVKRDEIMLFGVRVVVDPMRKCVSLNNLSDYEEKSSPDDDQIPKLLVAGEDKNEADATTVILADGYASANDAVHISSSSGGNRERKRGVPWTENEHKRFLIGLQKVGKGDWKGISRNFVKSRTPTQVASHAQKYFLRRTNLNRRRRRSSLFDITTDTVTDMPMEQDQAQECSPLPETNISSGHDQVMQVFPEVAVPTKIETSPQQTFNLNDTYLVPVTFQANPAFNLNTDAAPLSLNLSLATSFNLNEQPNSRHSAFTMMPSFSDGDSNSSIIRVG
ncbi:PREDICTED: transcription factor MYB1R1 [Camelina sativa]|uniref:Transcription factor MYB1R1 n=1 Tax=Camelina sativa TaxID=90675 RepID=A0ABM1RJ91_CAMSA|nr:PREDICTED: transcription factor MYB1R1 [Camelina sativa]XP_019099079.1 PREDICTED: transcription factor MYB1R1 [Camelina sativa]XP_019099080.1 PREDICTED: transcription factor MYB1R1 [Camelina sativa]